MRDRGKAARAVDCIDGVYMSRYVRYLPGRLVRHLVVVEGPLAEGERKRLVARAGEFGVHVLEATAPAGSDADEDARVRTREISDRVAAESLAAVLREDGFEAVAEAERVIAQGEKEDREGTAGSPQEFLRACIRSVLDGCAVSREAASRFLVVAGPFSTESEVLAVVEKADSDGVSVRNVSGRAGSGWAYVAWLDSSVAVHRTAGLLKESGCVMVAVEATA